MSKTSKSLLIVLIACQALLMASVARAEDPATAEVLFQEDRRLMANDQVKATCNKFKESFTLDPMSGTLLNLAACYEKAGRTATAWARFRNAASLAKSQGKTEQAVEANRRIKVLEAELSYLTIIVAEPVADLEVKRNDTEVSSATFGVQVPVDPGRVEVVASAPGYKSFRQVVDIGSNHDQQTITIPKLNAAERVAATEAPEAGAAAPAAPSTAKNDIASESESESESEAEDEPGAGPARAQKTDIGSGGPGPLPWIIGGIGVAAAATGGVLGVLALQSDAKARDLCPTHKNCPKNALIAEDNRNQRATWANVGVGVGLVGIATATVWILVGRPKRSDHDRTGFVLQPAVTPDAAALWAIGKF
jgi:hypothetical protein